MASQVIALLIFGGLFVFGFFLLVSFANLFAFGTYCGFVDKVAEDPSCAPDKIDISPAKNETHTVIKTAQHNPPTKQKVRALAAAQSGGKCPRTADTRSASGQDGVLGEKDGALDDADHAAAEAALDIFRPGTKTVHQTVFSTLYLL
jgi:hypothetical protein